jgi:transposase-like protein
MDDILAPRFIDPVAARKHLEALRWPDDEPVCPHCGSTDTTRLEGKKHRDGLLQCNDCREQFTVTVGTVFERSKVPLNKWLLCNHLLCAGKKGISAHQIHRMLGVTYKTAWFMCHRLREAMKDDGSPLGGPGKIVESDEAFVGGSKKKRLSRKTAPMKKVVSLVERDGQAVFKGWRRSLEHCREFLFHPQAWRDRHLSPLERSTHAPLLGRVRFPLFAQGHFRPRTR